METYNRFSNMSTNLWNREVPVSSDEEEIEIADSHVELGVGAEAGKFRDDFACCLVQTEDLLTPGFIYVFEKALVFKASRLVESYFLHIKTELVVGVRLIDDMVCHIHRIGLVGLFEVYVFGRCMYCVV
jgi:hypothetical protein